MTRSVQWHRLSPTRHDREQHVLRSLPYFTLEHTTINERGAFVVIGTLHFFGQRSGKMHALRIRVEYPWDFPRHVPRIFDHDRLLTPSNDGHLIGNHELCLTLPERGEFTPGADDLTEQVLGAALLWWHKRAIYDRTNTFPGRSERHGINAVIDLLVERRVAPDATVLSNWLLTHATTAQGTVQLPSPYAPCPCGNGKALKFCHGEELRPLVQRLKHFPATIPLIAGLDRKLETDHA